MDSDISDILSARWRGTDLTGQDCSVILKLGYIPQAPSLSPWSFGPLARYSHKGRATKEVRLSLGGECIPILPVLCKELAANWLPNSTQAPREVKQGAPTSEEVTNILSQIMNWKRNLFIEGKRMQAI